MKITVGSVAVEMQEDGDRVCHHARVDRDGFEPRTLHVWSALCVYRRGLFLDVGAYTGLFAISAAMHFRDVVAFEPMPRNAERLISNALNNGVRDRIRLIEAAASDVAGKDARLRYNAAMKGLTSGASLSGKGALLDVPAATIDMFEFPDVAAIKIDVERAEPLVLAGARATIERCKPAIIVEVLDADTGEAVKAQLPGYRCAELMDGRNWLMQPC